MKKPTIVVKGINYWYRIKRELWLKHIRRENRNHSFSLIANDCIGGTISYDLKEEFRSPTVKVLIPNDCYLKFVTDLEYYLSCEIKEKLNSGKPYPVGVLVPKDEEHIPIELHFEHDTCWDVPYKKWVKRCQRVNYEKLYFIWHFFDEDDERDIRVFDSLNIRKLIILHKQIQGIKNGVVVNCYDEDPYSGKILTVIDRTGKRYLDEVDYIGFLNKDS